MQTPSSSSGFHGLGIAPALLEIIAKLGIQEPTPIQRQAIPVAMEGNDVVGIAQTGTGKTLAFGLPMLQRLAQHKGRGLVLLPTRELAIQVDESLKKVGSSIGLRTAVLIGGVPMGGQLHALRTAPHVIVATPGRLIDHMTQGSLSLKEIKILVLDEADRMLDMGFAPQLKRIFEAMPTERQTMLFSATMPTDIVQIARKHMKQPTQVEIARQGTTADTITQELFIVRKEEKPRLISKILQERKGSTLVFCRTKHGARKLTRSIRGMGHTAAEIHSDRTQGQRQMALQGFRNGSFRVLVATDIAARGIDVKGVELVINFDLPDQAEDYVHRIGRTGRAGASGVAISFATSDQLRDVRTIERLIRTSLPVTPLPELPELPPASLLPPETSYDRPSYSGRSSRGGSSSGRTYRGGGEYVGSEHRSYSGSRGGYRGSTSRGPSRGRSRGARSYS
jgi:ATP-dependent RNA helicase RhlE